MSMNVEVVAAGHVVTIRECQVGEEERTLALEIDGEFVGDVVFVKYYGPSTLITNHLIGLWAGTLLCVIDANEKKFRVVKRDDEIYRIYPFLSLWCIQGELSVELFDPVAHVVSAHYDHREVITASWWDDNLICVRDFAGATVCLDPANGL